MADYININEYLTYDYPFQLFIGGRGTGKTYSALKGVIERGKPFIYMRRSGTELDVIVDSDKGEGANPFKTLNRDLGINIGIHAINKHLNGIYRRELNEEGIAKPVGSPIGYAVALTTFSKIRGIDFSDCVDLVYDEFIPEIHERKLSGECDAFLNIIESINRNREFDGREPIRVTLLANSNNIYNPIFIGLNIVSTVERATRKGKTDILIRERGLGIHLLATPESFINKKKKTALYKLTAGTRFYDMALGNSFAYNDFSLVGYRQLNQYRPLCNLDNGCIYISKDNSEAYYSYAHARAESFNSSIKQDGIRFNKDYGIWLRQYYVEGKIIFESIELKELFLDLVL